jgi:hypothetical protein
MSPLLLLVLLVAALLALIPVWRLRIAAWRPGWLLTAWLVYTLGIILVLRVPGPARFLVPILVLAYVAPFVAGPERLTRLFGTRPGPPRRVIDVTPRPPDRDGGGGDEPGNGA